MTRLLKVFKKATDRFFGIRVVEQVEPVLKTRAQLIEEGRGAYLPKRHRNDAPILKKH